MINKKRYLVLLLVLVHTILAISVSSCRNNNEPEIDATLTVSKLTDEDFQEIGTENVTKEDFRKVVFKLDISNMSNRTISVPNLREVMNSYDIERYWYGDSTSNDNAGTTYAMYFYDIMFYSRGLDNEGIKSVFKDAKIYIFWKDNDGNDKDEMINLTDIIKFE